MLRVQLKHRYPERLLAIASRLDVSPTQAMCMLIDNALTDTNILSSLEAKEISINGKADPSHL